MALEIPPPELLTRFRQAVRNTQKSQARTIFASVPAAILIAAVLGTFAMRELLWTVVCVAVIAAILLPAAHTLDRRFLRPVRKAITEPQNYEPGPAIARARELPKRILVMYVVLYGVGAMAAAMCGNLIAHFPLFADFGAVTVAGIAGGLVDGTLNFLSTEVLSARIIAMICEAHGILAPINTSARGVIERPHAVHAGGSRAHPLRGFRLPWRVTFSSLIPSTDWRI